MNNARMLKGEFELDIGPRNWLENHRDGLARQRQNQPMVETYFRALDDLFRASEEVI